MLMESYHLFKNYLYLIDCFAFMYVCVPVETRRGIGTPGAGVLDSVSRHAGVGNSGSSAE